MPLSDYFQFAPATSFRMVKENAVRDPRYNNRSIDDYIDNSCYCQPWQTNDINARLQVFTPYSNDTLGLYSFYGDAKIQNVPLTPINPPLLNQPFVCMNGLPDFSSVPPGKYYLKYTYTDENSVIQDIRSSPLNIQVDQPNTMLYEVTNNKNEKGTIFLNGDGSYVTFAYRVEAAIREPSVKNSSQNYDGEYYNLTQPSYIPYETYINYIGIGLPKAG